MNPVLDRHPAQIIRGFYGMVDVSAHTSAAQALDLGRALLEGGARVLQLRYKNASASQMLALAAELAPLCQQASARFVVNDRLDVALASGADGVHLGQTDLPLEAARHALKRSGGSLLIGISTHNFLQAQKAVAGGADYLGFGPCFPTRSKANPDEQVSLAELHKVCQLGVPVVAIGGIGPENIADVVAAGAAAAAAIESVNLAPSVRAAVQALTQAWPTTLA